MTRKTKLLILIVLSLSVYFIYKHNNNYDIKITTFGDGLALGINSYGIKDFGYIDYYKDYLLKQNSKVELNNDYWKEDLSIAELLEKVKTNPKIKRNLLESHLIILNLGYNDLTYKLALEDNVNYSILQKQLNKIEKDYNSLIMEIKKYYKNNIVVIGYYPLNSKDYYWNKGIIQLNNILTEPPNITYINTSELLSNNKKYFSNPNSHYPNKEAYQLIANEIIAKTLENKEIIWYSSMALNYYGK